MDIEGVQTIQRWIGGERRGNWFRDAACEHVLCCGRRDVAAGASLIMRLKRASHSLQAALLIAPFSLLYVVAFCYPLGRSFVLSFCRTDGIGNRPTFLGLANYRFLLADRVFWGATANTVAFTAAFVLLQVPISLALAIAVDACPCWLRSPLRFGFFSTYLVGPVYAAIVFISLLAPRGGPINRGLSLLRGRTIEINWLGDPHFAMAGVLLASLWLSVGAGMVYCLAAIRGVDPQLYDAAHADGANAWARFRHVTLPGVRPTLAVLVLVGIAGGLQLFELPVILFGGAGPAGAGTTVVMYLFNAGFENGNLGYASAVGWALVGITVIALFIFRALPRFSSPPGKR